MSLQAMRDAAGGEESRTVAVIDLGSNSWRLVVFSYAAASGAWWKRTDELYETVRIGAGEDASGELSEEAIARGLETLGVLGRFCRAAELGPGDVHAIATSAIREAANQEEFLSRARECTDRFEIEVLSGEEEARMGYVAAVNSTTLTDGGVLEIGGGSLQLIEVADRRPGQLASLELGAVRLTERFLPDDDPAKKGRLRKLREYVTSELERLDWLRGTGGRLVGIGGAVRNLAAAAQLAATNVDVGVQGFVITRETLKDLVAELAALPVSERGNIPGVKPGRGDIILAAAATIQAVLEFGDFEGIEATEAGLREGVFLSRELLADGEPLLPDVRRAGVSNLAMQYESDLPHVRHVAELATQLFDSLAEKEVFKPTEGERELLWAAAMLHDVGMAVSYDDHHKHSRYLILNAGLPGFDPRERALIAQIARYHRKGVPKLGVYAPLARDGDEDVLARCAAIVRIAEHLERGRDQAVRKVTISRNGDYTRLRLIAAGDLTLPRWSLERYGDNDLFEAVFGHRLVVG